MSAGTGTVAGFACSERSGVLNADERPATPPIVINAAAATLGTPLFGFIVDQTESYPTAWQLLAAAVAASCVGLAAFLKEPRPTVEPSL